MPAQDPSAICPSLGSPEGPEPWGEEQQKSRCLCGRIYSFGYYCKMLKELIFREALAGCLWITCGLRSSGVETLLYGIQFNRFWFGWSDSCFNRFWYGRSDSCFNRFWFEWSDLWQLNLSFGNQQKSHEKTKM